MPQESELPDHRPLITPPGGLEALYDARFDERARRGKIGVWAEIVRFLQRHIDKSLPVVDIACDAGYFIRHAQGSERWATDIRDVRDNLPTDVRFVLANGLKLDEHLPRDHFGTAFMSNYLEHLASAAAVIEQIRVASALLRPGGRLIVLQPNIKLTGNAYWDFIDHHVPLTDRSLVEAGEIAGLRTERLVARFLPYSTKSRLPQDPRLVRAYLAFPPAWRVLGKQSLYIGRKV
jgi:SAM-dependent methyltransferase